MCLIRMGGGVSGRLRGVRWAVLAMLCAGPCRGAPVTVRLVPGTATIGLTVYAMGLLPMLGRFQRFSGSLVIDTDQADACAVTLDVEVGSLKMNDGPRTRMALGPGLLDAAHFPSLHYAGTCSAGASTGALTLHGVTRDISLAAQRSGDVVSATGSLRRGDYGIDGLPALIGRRVEMHLSVTLPPGLAARLHPG